jgi:uncharacterized damage-inducible protein DinB
MKKQKHYIIMTLLLLGSVNIKAQNLKVDRMVYAWGNMKDMVVNTVKDLPEDKWSFSPTDSVNTFREQVKHISTSNRFFPGILAGKNEVLQEMNKKTGELKSKTEIISDLEQSFDFAIASIQEIEEWDLVIDAYGNKVSKLELLMQAEHHLHREHGKIIVMMRMNGVAPARSTSWFK